MIRAQSLIQWDVRRGGDVEVLGDLKSRPARDRGRRLRELALLGLLAERRGFQLGGEDGLAQLGVGPVALEALMDSGTATTGAHLASPTSSIGRASESQGQAQAPAVDVEALDDFMGDLLGGLE